MPASIRGRALSKCRSMRTPEGNKHPGFCSRKHGTNLHIHHNNGLQARPKLCIISMWSNQSNQILQKFKTQKQKNFNKQWAWLTVFLLIRDSNDNWLGMVTFYVLAAGRQACYMYLQSCSTCDLLPSSSSESYSLNYF